MGGNESGPRPPAATWCETCQAVTPCQIMPDQEPPHVCLACVGVPDLPLWRLCSSGEPVRFETECEA